MKYDYKTRYEVEKNEEWRTMYDEIPSLHFEKELEVKIIPPFGGAIIRFIIDYRDKSVSVYLDWFANLGYVKEPYWEVYNFNEEDPVRFLLNDTIEMMAYIKKYLEESENAK